MSDSLSKRRKEQPSALPTRPEGEEPKVFAARRARPRKATVASAVDPARVAAGAGVRTLCVDVGGTGLKVLVVDHRGEPLGERLRVPTPRPATPAALLKALRKLMTAAGKFDRVSVGFPGVVTGGVIRTAPNLDGKWDNFHLGEKLGALCKKPVRVLNDAGVQGFGVIEGKGVELALTFGTGMGCALFVDGHYVPNLELGHHPFKGHKTYEEYVSERARQKAGNKKWNKHVARVVAQVIPVFNPDRMYLGGGNSKHLKLDLPPHVRITPNEAGLLGGLALWRE